MKIALKVPTKARLGPITRRALISPVSLMPATALM